MQHPHDTFVLVSVGYWKTVHILALSFLPLASRNLGDAVDDGGSGVEEEQRKWKQIRMICSFNVAFSLHNFICFISEEMGSTTITKKLKSSLFIPGVMPGLSTLMPFCFIHEGPRGREFYPRVYVRPRSDNFVFTLYYQHLHQSSRALCSRE